METNAVLGQPQWGHSAVRTRLSDTRVISDVDQIA